MTIISKLKDSVNFVYFSELSVGDGFIDDEAKEGALFFKIDDSSREPNAVSFYEMGNPIVCVETWDFDACDEVVPVDVEIIVRKKLDN